MKLRNYVLLGAASLSLGTAAVVAQPTSASAKTAIPARFRHNWKSSVHGYTEALKIHKYDAYVYEGYHGHGSWEKRYYVKKSKNRYAVVAPKSKQENPEFIVYKNSHKLLFCMDVRYITMHRY